MSGRVLIVVLCRESRGGLDVLVGLLSVRLWGLVGLAFCFVVVRVGWDVREAMLRICSVDDEVVKFVERQCLEVCSEIRRRWGAVHLSEWGCGKSDG